MRNRIANHLSIDTQLKIAMIQGQVTTAQLAHRLDESNGFVGRIKRGAPCHIHTVRRVAHAFGLELNQFLELE